MGKTDRDKRSNGGEMDEHEQFVALTKRFGQLVVECGIYKRALEEIYVSESPDEFGIQVALIALNKAHEYLRSQGIEVQ